MAGKAAGAAVRAAAAGAVDAVTSAGRSLDVALSTAEATLPVSEHALLRMLAFGTLRHYWQLQEWAGELIDRPLRQRDSVVQALLLVGLYQLSDTRIPDHAAVSATVEATRALKRPKLAGFLNAVLRRFMREQLVEREAVSDEARYNHPAWLIEALRRDWPDDWSSILAANNSRAPMFLRINRQRETPASYRERLAAVDISAEAPDGLPAALLLEQAVPVASLPGFADGDVSVQDGAAQLAAPWLLDGGTGRILDACAAPGGKSAHLKELGGAEIDLTCLDIDAERVASIVDNFKRLHLDATITTGDASKPGDWAGQQPFDGILLDAPCSATGVIRRHPDIKLLRRAADIDRLAALQGAILDALWPRLRRGGRLLYVTCSVLARENDAVVSRFIAAHDDARENQMLQNNNMRDVMQRKACGYQVLPGSRGMDGFYFACLEKVV